VVVVGQGARHHITRSDFTAMPISLQFIAEALMFLPSLFGAN
jgi:hypothetical protein